MINPLPVDDFCPKCSTYMADLRTCPNCGARRRVKPDTDAGSSVEVMATYAFVDNVQPGLVSAGSSLFVAMLAREGEHGNRFGQLGNRFGRLLAIDLTQPAEIWRFDLPTDLLNPPLVISEGRLFFATQTADPLALKASLHAVDIVTGEELWRWEPKMRALSAPALMDGVLWTVGDGNQLWAVEAGSGHAEPSVQLQGQRHIAAPATASESLLIIPSRGPLLQAIDIVEHEVAWQYQHPTAAWAGTPLTLGSQVIVPFTDGSLTALDQNSGVVNWAKPPSGRHLPPLMGDGKRLFAGGRRGLEALNLQDGDPIWRMDSPRRVSAPPLLYRTVVIVAGHDHIVRGLDAGTGQEQWHWEGKRGFDVAPAITPAGLALVDVSNTLSVLAFPNPEPTIDEALTERAWRVAASAMAREGRLSEAALLLEEQEEAFAAAEVWMKAGDMKRAIGQYETSDTEAGWEHAAELHQQLGHWRPHAEALQRLAELVDNIDAWERARLAYLDIPMQKEAAACWREVCRIRRYPFVRIEVRPDTGFVLDRYSLLTLSINNEGYGIARMLSARAHGPFAGADMQSRVMGNLAPDRSTELQLSLMPTSAGTVILELEISFLLDQDGEPWIVKQRYPVDVAPIHDQRQSPIDLAQQLNAGFDVVSRDEFRRSSDKLESLYRQQLAAHQKNLARWNLRKAEFGILAPVEIDNLIDREEQALLELQRKLDKLQEE